MRKIRFRHVIVGSDHIIESDLIVASEKEWNAAPESKQEGWSVHRRTSRAGPRVTALFLGAGDIDATEALEKSGLLRRI